MHSGTFLEERRDSIVRLVSERGRVSTKELSDMLHISVVTIRNDINDLASRGLIVKTHGGALALSKVLNYELPSSFKSLKNQKEKEMIGRKAASCIQSGDVVILDAGSTTFAIARNLPCQDITVVTNDLQIAEYLASNTSVELIVSGGTKIPRVYTLAGIETIMFFGRIHADKLFLGCDAFNIDHGITNRTLSEADIKRAMIASADSVYAVADSSKLGKRLFASVCSLDQLDVFVTDSIPEQDIKRITERGVTVLIGDENE